MTEEEPQPLKPLAASREAPVLHAKPRAASSSHFLPGKGVWGVGLLLALVAFAVWYFAIRTPEPRDDIGRFQGEWKLTIADRTRQAPVSVRVTGDTWVWLVGDKEQRRYAITLRPDADPKEIDLTQLGPDGKQTAFVLRGIYTIDGDGAKVLAVPGSQPRPTTFDAADGMPMWLLERMK